MQQAPPPPAVRGLGYAAAAWSLGFAGVSVWLVAGMAGEPGKAGLVILSGDPVPLGPAARLTPHEFPASRYAPRHQRLRS